MTIGEQIKFFRKKSKLTQEQLAMKSGLSRNAIYNYENNKRSPSMETLNKIAEVFNISVTELLYDAVKIGPGIYTANNDDIIFDNKEAKVGILSKVEEILKIGSSDPLRDINEILEEFVYILKLDFVNTEIRNNANEKELIKIEVEKKLLQSKSNVIIKINEVYEHRRKVANNYINKSQSITIVSKNDNE